MQAWDPGGVGCTMMLMMHCLVQLCPTSRRHPTSRSTDACRWKNSGPQAFGIQVRHVLFHQLCLALRDDQSHLNDRCTVHAKGSSRPTHTRLARLDSTMSTMVVR